MQSFWVKVEYCSTSPRTCWIVWVWDFYTVTVEMCGLFSSVSKNRLPLPPISASLLQAYPRQSNWFHNMVIRHNISYKQSNNLILYILLHCKLGSERVHSGSHKQLSPVAAAADCCPPGVRHWGLCVPAVSCWVSLDRVEELGDVFLSGFVHVDHGPLHTYEERGKNICMYTYVLLLLHFVSLKGLTWQHHSGIAPTY